MAPTTIDLVGKQIGRLKILTYLGCAKWECLCNCGNKIVIKTESLTRVKATRSCGCLQREVASKAMMDRSGLPRKDLNGQRMGKLTVINFAGIDPTTLDLSRHRLLWNCLCDCGRAITLRGYVLTRTTRPTRSCGCLRPGDRETRKPTTIRFKAPKAPKFTKPTNLEPKLTEDQNQHCAAEYNRILAIADSDMPFWADVDIFPKWRNYDEFRDWIEDELPPLVIGSRLTRISRYAGFIPGNIRWSDPVQKMR